MSSSIPTAAGSDGLVGEHQHSAAAELPGTPPREILEGAGFKNIEHTAFDVVADVGPEAIVDEEQLVFLGVPEDRLPEAREAVAAHLTQFARPDGRYDAPLAVQIFLAGS